MEKKLHSLLEKQLEQIKPLISGLPESERGGFLEFVEKINAAYVQYDDDRELLENSMELSSAELIEANREMRAQNREIKALYDISNFLHSTTDPQTGCSQALREISQVMQFPMAALELFDEDARAFSLVAELGFRPEELEKRGHRVPLQESFSSHAQISGMELYVSHEIEQQPGYEKFWKAHSAQTIVCVPIRSGEILLGSLMLARAEKTEVSPRARQWLRTVAGQLSTSIDRNRLDRVLRQQQASMLTSAKMSALGEMAGGVAHEINTPLAVIKLLANQLHEVAEDAQIDRALMRDMTFQVEKTVDRVAKIVQGLRTFSRDGRRDEFQPVFLSRLVEETLAFCSERFKTSGTKMIVEGIDANLCVDGQATQLSQVLLNLLNNARDAISCLPEKWIQLSVRMSGEFAEIVVKDSGRGIPPEIQEKMFQPFFTTKEIGKGTGLGLSISSSIIKDHGGELLLDSLCPNTCFVIRLPRKQAMREAA